MDDLDDSPTAMARPPSPAATPKHSPTKSVGGKSRASRSGVVGKAAVAKAAPKTDAKKGARKVREDKTDELERAREAKGGKKRKSLGGVPKSQATPQMRKCRGCPLFYERSQFYPDTNFDFECKRVYDQVAKLSVRQGVQDWWNSVKIDEKELQVVLRKYKKRKLEQDPNAHEKALNLTQCFQINRVRDEDELVQRGRLMWKEEYIQWAGTLEGGQMPRHVAEAKWATMLADRSVKRLLNGPEDAPTKLHIETHVEINTRSINGRERVVQNGGAVKKNISEDEIAALREKAFLDLNRIVSPEERELRLRSMVASAGEGFGEASMMKINVKGLSSQKYQDDDMDAAGDGADEKDEKKDEKSIADEKKDDEDVQEAPNVDPSKIATKKTGLKRDLQGLQKDALQLIKAGNLAV